MRECSRKRGYVTAISTFPEVRDDRQNETASCIDQDSCARACYSVHPVTPTLESDMTICPVAIAVGCSKCPVLKVCPLKSVLGDAAKPPAAKPATTRKKK